MNIDWYSILLGEETWTFLLEVLVRTTIMFAIVLISLRLIGKRAMMRGVFEVALIVSLGSAAGDAMFYSKVGLLPAILVFAVIIGLYKIINHYMFRSSYFDQMLQGTLIHLIEDGVFLLEALKTEELGRNEIYSDLRLLNISQLGQVKHAYIESNGKISVFFSPDDEVRYGLPILPERLEQKLGTITAPGHFSCAYCANTELVTAPKLFVCTNCGTEECIKSENWVRAI